MRSIFLSIFFCSFLIGAQTVLAQSDGDYRTAQSGNWTDASTWEVYSGGSWIAATSTPTSADGVISILDTHTVTVISNLTVDQTVIESNGSIAVDPFNTLIINDGVGDDLLIQSGGSLILNDDFFFDGSILNVNGTVLNRGNLTLSDPNLSTINFNANSVYQHDQNNGAIPISNWDSSSTIIITGVTNGVPSNMNQSYGNFTWNCASQSTTLFLGFTGSNTSVAGDFTISSTGGRTLAISSGSGVTLDVGNFNLSGSTRFALTSSGSVTVNTLNFANTSTFLFLGTSGTGVLNVEGDFNHNFGTIQGTATSRVSFSGSNEQIYDAVGGSYNNVNFRINSSAIVNSGSSNFSGTGTFTMNTGSTLILSEIDGISSGTTQGAIRVSGTRSINIGTSFEFSGSSPQSLGDGFPASDVNLIINNTGGGVDMESDLTISSGRSLTLTEGSLNIGDGNLLTLNGSVTTTNGGISGGPLSDLTIGGSGVFGTLGFVGTNELQNFTINRTSSGSVTLGGDLSVLNFTQTEGDLNLNGNVFTITGDISQSAGSINTSATSSFIVGGTGTITDPLSITGTLQKLQMDRGSTTLNTGSSSITADSILVFSGTLNYGSGQMTVADGGYVERRNGGTFGGALNTATSYNLTYNNNAVLTTGPELPTTSTVLNNLTKLGTSTVTLAANTTINGNLTLSNGELDASNFNIELLGDFISNANSDLLLSTFTFGGTTNQSGTVNPDFGNVIVNGSLNLSSDLNIAGDLTNNGTLTAASGIINFTGTTNLLGSNDIQANSITIGSGNSLTANNTVAGTSNNLILSGDFTNNGTFNANGDTIVFSGTTNLLGTVPTFSTIEISGTLNAPTTLELQGNFINEGTFNTNSGLVRFSGAGAKDITGASSTVFHDLEVTGGSLTNNGIVTLNNSLEFSGTPTVDLDGSGSGSFTLVSNASNDAYIGDATGATLSGAITAERYISQLNAENKGYHVMSFPASGVTVADLQNEISVTGTFSGSSTGTGFDNNASIFAYDEDAGAGLTLNERYVTFPDSGNGETFNVGEGYFVYTYANEAPVTVDGTGEISAGDFNSGTLTYTGSNDADAGWHLVANPYPAATDWKAWTKNNVAGNTAYVYNPSNGSYITLDDAAPGELIAKGQAFFVKVNSGGGSVSATESSKSTSGTVFYRNQNNVERFEIIASWINSDLSPAEQSDRTIIKFEEGSSDGGDTNDNTGQLNTYEGLFTYDAKGERQQVNSLSKQDSVCLREFGILLDKFQENRTYTLSFSGIETLVNKDIYLNDLYTNETYLISNDLEIQFTINSDAASGGDQRFSFSVDDAKPMAIEIVDQLVCEGNSTTVELDTSFANYTYILQLEDSVILSMEGNGSPLAFDISADILQETNGFKIQAFQKNCDSILIDSFMIDKSTLQLTNPGDVNICLGESASINFNLNDNVSTLYLYESGDLIDSTTTGIFEVDPQVSTSYEVVAALNSGCISEAIGFNVTVNSVDSPLISANGNVLETTAEADIYKWYLNGELIEGENASILTMNVEGDYTLEVSLNNCTAVSDVYSYEIEEVTATDDRLITDIKAYPNPVIDYYMVEKTSALGEVKVRILTVNGQFIDQFILKKQQNKLNLSKLAAGTYIIQYESELGSYSKRIVKR